MNSPAQEQTKKCSKCGEIKGVGEFYSHNRSWCKECIKIISKQYYWSNHQKKIEYEKTPRRVESRRARARQYRKTPKYREREEKLKINGYYREKSLRVKYGLSLEKWNKLFKLQNESCAICGKKKSGGKGWVVDHNHTTGLVRGILCNVCNRGIGYLQDSPSILRSAADYLEKWEDNP